jgi:peptide-methionine (S)-S-oxide reductase
MISILALELRWEIRIRMEQATFGAGCFWAVEAAFRQIPGVLKTSVGYMGGHFEHPCHLDVVARITGHAEVAQVEFDSTIVTYATLLATFWAIHDPTSVNRQGADRGEQYRSMIFCHTPEQEAIARQSKREFEASGRYEKAIVTEIKSAAAYWLANDEHQQYFEKKRQRVS